MTDHTEATDPRAYEPVKVHVASVGPGVSLGTAKKRRSCEDHDHVAHFKTVVLTSTMTSDELVPLDTSRCYSEVQAGGNNAVICEAVSESIAAANQTAGLPNPIGMVLPSGNTVPTKIPGGQRLWVTAAAYPTQVTVMMVQEAE